MNLRKPPPQETKHERLARARELLAAFDKSTTSRMPGVALVPIDDARAQHTRVQHMPHDRLGPLDAAATATRNRRHLPWRL